MSRSWVRMSGALAPPRTRLTHGALTGSDRIRRNPPQSACLQPACNRNPGATAYSCFLLPL